MHNLIVECMSDSILSRLGRNWLVGLAAPRKRGKLLTLKHIVFYIQSSSRWGHIKSGSHQYASSHPVVFRFYEAAFNTDRFGRTLEEAPETWRMKCDTDCACWVPSC